MSDCLFPALAGLTWDGVAVPTWSTVVQRSKNRARTVLMNDPYPLWTFDLTYEFLRGPSFYTSAPQSPSTGNPAGYSELEQIVGFYNARGGGFDSFLLDPQLISRAPTDGLVNGGPVGTGDGTTTTFYLHRDCGGFADEVQNPVGPVTLAVNGAVAAPSTWTLGSNGAVTFNTAPASNAVITWDGAWRYRVCFAEDELGLKGFMYQLYELQTVKLEEVKR